MGEAPPRRGSPHLQPGEKVPREGNTLLPPLSRKEVVCARLKTRETQKKEKGQGGSFPLSYQPQETRSYWEREPSESPARAAEPEPTTKGHSQSGLIRPGSPAAALGHTGRIQGPHTIGPLWGAGKGARGL